MNVRYINPFIEGIKAVFSTMLKTDILISKPIVKTDNDRTTEVAAIIRFSGDATGCVALCFPMRSALATARKFTGMDINKDDDYFADALGELVNMVSGQARSKLEGLHCNVELPEVVVGKGHEVVRSNGAPWLALPCDSMLGRFCVEVAMVMQENASDPRTCAAGSATC